MRVVERHLHREDIDGATQYGARLFPRLMVSDVPPQPHGVLKQSADDQHVALATTKEEASRPVNRLSGSAGAALRQGPGEYAFAQFRSGDVPDIVGARNRVADCRGDQVLTTLAGFLTERFL